MSGPSSGERPLGPAQLGVWYAQRHDPTNAMFNQGGYVEIRGPVELPLLVQTVTGLVAEDDTLRIRFTETDGEPAQCLGPPVEFIPQVHDVSAAADPLAAARVVMHADMAKVCDPTRDRLFEHILFVLGPERVIWYSRAHHLIHDGYTDTILRRRAAELYRGLVAGRPAAGAPLGSYWQALSEQDAYAGSAAQRRDAAYWSGVMAGVESPAQPVSGQKPGSRIIREPSYLDDEAFALLCQFGERAGVTWQQGLITAAVLHRHLLTGDPEPMLSLPVSGRLRPSGRNVPGMMANVVPLRCAIDPAESCEELAVRVAAEILRGQWHQRYDTADLLRDLGWPATGHQRFGPVINIIGGEDRPVFAGMPAVGHMISTGGTVEELSVTATLPHQPGARVRLDFAVDAAYGRADDVAMYRRTFHHLLATMTGQPGVGVGGVGVLGEVERGLVVSGWCGSVVGVAGGSLVGLFEERVRVGGLALVCDEVGLSYGELNRRANRVARWLVSVGVGRGDVVGVLLERGIDFAVVLLAVAKVGAAYSVLDPEFPDERLAWAVSAADAAVVVSCSELAGRLAGVSRVVCVDPGVVDGFPDGDLGITVSADDVACVMFTSGSTGVPKGVVSSHRALVGSVQGQRYATFGPGEVFLQCSPVSWDAFSLEFWGALLFGGVCVLQPGQRPEPQLMAQLVPAHRVSMLQLSSGLFNLLVEEYPQIFAGVRLAFTGGEPASAPHVARILARYPQLRVANGYGPAESMGFTTTFDVPAGFAEPTVPVGTPVANKRCYLLDARLRPVPIGVTGELYLGGVGLAYGYLGRADLTAQRFVADPFTGDGARLYRTGDLARWTPDGVLEFTGRADAQVKIRGFRVEPGEIETVLHNHPDVTGAAVCAHPDNTGTLRLTAYLTTRDHTDPATVRQWLTSRLPDHMIPSHIVPIDRLPLTPNGKLDRPALPPPPTATGTGRPPRTPHEEILCTLWAEVLDIPTVTIDDNFFDLGGHSLHAARLTARTRTTLGINLTIRDLFQTPTIATLTQQHTTTKPKPHRPTLHRRTTAGERLPT
jgi:nonribosomal peptide synthetase DhbF